MEYKAKLPSRNSNVSHAAPIKEFTTLVFGVAALLLLVYWLLGFVVDYIVDYISDEHAAEIYHSLNDVASEQMPADNTASPRLQALLDQLVAHSDIPYRIQLSVADAEQMNAVAFPTGHIVVFQELLDGLSTENGIAFVLAHEIAHFKNRDHLRSMGRGVLLMAASMLLGVGDNDVMQMLSPITNFSIAQYSQQRESAADATALILLNQHYGHIGGATEFFDLLQENDNELSFAYSHYFASHPQIQQRIEQLQHLGDSMGFEIKPTITKN